MSTMRLNRTDYDLIIGVKTTGEPQLLQQERGDAATAETLRVLASRIDVDGVGINSAEPDIALTPPLRGESVLACRCGKVLDRAQMRWAQELRSAVVPRIACLACATVMDEDEEEEE